MFKLAPDGTVTSLAGTGLPRSTGDGGPAGSADLYYPDGLVLDGQGAIILHDSSGLRKIALDGKISLLSPLSNSGGDTLARGPDGSIYVTGSWSQKVMRLTPAGSLVDFAGNGTAGSSGDGGPALSAQLNYPRGVAVDSQGRVYISEQYGHRVRRVELNGTITTVAGTGVGGFSGDSGPATQAQLYYPGDLTFDSLGNLIIADTSNNRARRVSNGIITTLIGGT